MDEALPSPWDTFRRLQAITDSAVVTARTNAREEALSELLEELATGEVPSDAAAVERRYWALTGNRAKKYRYRAALADQVAHHEQHGHQHRDQPDLPALRELVALASEGLAPHDRELLQVISAGTPYSDIASRLGRPVGTLKARVSRLRRQVRDSHVGSTIRLAMAAA
jgi:DNA-directed RNA polymerase specialized sigma24 family protein